MNLEIYFEYFKIVEILFGSLNHSVEYVIISFVCLKLLLILRLHTAYIIVGILEYTYVTTVENQRGYPNVWYTVIKS